MWTVSYRLGSEKKLLDYKTIKKVAVDSLIPGIAHSLIGMKRGEQRVVCMHPRYAYGVNSNPRNAVFFAEMQLLDYEEGESHFHVHPPADLEFAYQIMDSAGVRDAHLCELNSCSSEDLILKYRDLLARQKALHWQKYYNNGFQFWESLKTCGVQLDFEEFSKRLKNHTVSFFRNIEESQAFIFDFKVHLFSLQYRNGINPPFPQSWF